jgi:hypothetical protein
MKRSRLIFFAIALIALLGSVQQPAIARPSACTTLESISFMDDVLRWKVSSYSCLITGFEVRIVNCVPGNDCVGVMPANGYGPYEEYVGIGSSSATLAVLSEVLPDDSKVELARVKRLQSRVRLPVIMR